MIPRGLPRGSSLFSLLSCFILGSCAEVNIDDERIAAGVAEGDQTKAQKNWNPPPTGEKGTIELTQSLEFGQWLYTGEAYQIKYVILEKKMPSYATWKVFIYNESNELVASTTGSNTIDYSFMTPGTYRIRGEVSWIDGIIQTSYWKERTFTVINEPSMKILPEESPMVMGKQYTVLIDCPLRDGERCIFGALKLDNGMVLMHPGDENVAIIDSNNYFSYITFVAPGQYSMRMTMYLTLPSASKLFIRDITVI